MFPRHKTPPDDPATLTHEDITARQVAFDRRRRRRALLAVVASVALVAAVAFGVKPALHAAKAWQARRLSAEARRLMDQEKWLDARGKVQDAYALSSQEPEAVRTTADFLDRVNQPRQALAFWKQLDDLHALTPADQLGYAAAELNAGDPDAAAARLALAWPAGTPGSPAAWQLAMQLATRRDHAAEAADLARRILADPAAPVRTRFNAAATLLATTSGVAQRPGWQAFKDLAAEGKSPESLEALMTLARVAAAAGQPGTPTVDVGLPTLAECIQRIEKHPLAKARQQLFVLDLRIAQDPARRAELIQGAIDRYKSTRDDADLAALAAWLYGKGEYERALALLPLERAATDRTLFFQRLDNLGALGRWKEIRTVIQGQKFPIDPMTAQMYLARCAMQLNEPDVRDACWDAAFTAAKNDPAKLVTLGQYAAKNGASAVAGRALRAAVAAAPDAREANEAWFQWLDDAGQTRELHDALRAYAPRDPRNSAIRNDLAYLDALLDTDAASVRAARDTARELLRAEPGSLPHRVTLALAELREGNALGALDAFRGAVLPPPADMQPRQRAVYAAVLWQTSYERQASEIKALIAPGQLLPEERELIQPIADKPAP